VVEPIVFRLKLQLQAERSVKEARHSWGNVLSGRPEDGVRRGPVGRRRRFLLLGDRLTARPKHSDFRERIFLRGKIKERRSSVEAEPSRKALQAFRDPAPMTEGARSFRRRGANAHRSPWSLVKSQDVGPAKSGQLNDAMQRPFTWRFRPTLFSRFKSEKSFLEPDPGRRSGNRTQTRQAGSWKLPSPFWAASCSCSTSSSARPKIGKNRRREGFARSPADDAADGVALSKKADSRNSGALIFRVKTTDRPHRASDSEGLKDGKRYGSSSGRARASDTCCRTR